MTSSDISAILNQWVSWIVILGLPLLGFWLKRSFSSYLDQTARNLANHQDFEKLLDEQRKTTEQLESIRSEITHNVWLKQRRWELRREAYSSVLAELYERQLIYGQRLGDLRGTGTGTATTDVADLRLKFCGEDVKQVPSHAKVIATAYVTFQEEVQQVLRDYLSGLTRDVNEMTQTNVTPERLLEITQCTRDNVTKTYRAMLKMAGKELQDTE
jgi:hypothetical protein